MATKMAVKQEVIMPKSLTQWCAGRPLQILLHCQGQESSSSPLLELTRGEAAPLHPPNKEKYSRRGVRSENSWWPFCFDIGIRVLCTSSSSSSSEPLSSLSERGATSYLQKRKCFGQGKKTFTETYCVCLFSVGQLFIYVPLKNMCCNFFP